MKRICIMLAIATFFAACGNESANDGNKMDSVNSITLPADRSSDSLAIPDSMTSPGVGADSTGMRKDSAR